MIQSLRWFLLDIVLALLGAWAALGLSGMDAMVAGAAAVWFASDAILNELIGLDRIYEPGM